MHSNYPPGVTGHEPQITGEDFWNDDEEPEQTSGYCEDYPCCGHEAGDCFGQKYGSDESIKAQVERDWREGHGYCDHQAGIYNCDDDGYDEEDEDDA